MPVTKEQAEAMAYVAVAARPHGAPRWDAAGVVAAIRKVSHLHLADVALAVFRAADDRSLNTPAPIGIPSAPCWRERNADRPAEARPFDPAETCGHCSRIRAVCEADRNDTEHTFESIYARDARVAREQAARRRATEETA